MNIFDKSLNSVYTFYLEKAVSYQYQLDDGSTDNAYEVAPLKEVDLDISLPNISKESLNSFENKV